MSIAIRCYYCNVYLFLPVSSQRISRIFCCIIKYDCYIMYVLLHGFLAYYVTDQRNVPA